MSLRPSPAAPARARRPLWLALAGAVLLAATGAALAGSADAPYRPADEGQRPAGRGPQLLPEAFLRGFDPITVYFDDNVGPGRAPADDGPRRLSLTPPWPGAYTWADRRTLQFRPAEPWPPLTRFEVSAGGRTRTLATLMSAPSAMTPRDGSSELAPFRTVTLTFPQPLPLGALRSMLRLELRELPGLADSPSAVVDRFSMAPLPRAHDRDPAVYALTLDDDVPEGHRLVVSVSLALGEEDKVLWTGRLSTRAPFRLQSVRCASSDAQLSGGARNPPEQALACGNRGETPQLVFSAPVRDLTLTTLKQLVRLSPAVPDLGFEVYGGRVTLKGRFVPDTLYHLSIADAPLRDTAGRALVDPGTPDAWFYLGWKTPFVRWSQGSAIVEQNGPRMLPLVGYGDARADVRIHRIDALSPALWPFPSAGVTVDEQADPPFPGEEPAVPDRPGDPGDLAAHLRLLGAPLVSRIVDLPLAARGGTTRFGLELGPLLDGAVGKNRPGTYVVGLRRLTGKPERTFVRVQVTNLSVTVAEERERAIFHVRTLDRVEPVRGARVVLEGERRPERKKAPVPASFEVTTDADGRAVVPSLAAQEWKTIRRVSVSLGEDVLVLDTDDAPPRFASDHWSPGGRWLAWLLDKPPPPVNDHRLGFVFTERPIYRPGEPVFLKGYLRDKAAGELRVPAGLDEWSIRVEGPGDGRWTLPTTRSPLGGLAAVFREKDPPTGWYRAVLTNKAGNETYGERTFQIEAYRIPTFEVHLSVPPAVRLDAPFTARAVARYYAGGDVAGQPIAWRVTQRPYHYVPTGRPGFLFADSTQFARPGARATSEPVTRTATLGDDGSDRIEVNPALDIDGSPRTYRFEATVTGADDQPVTAAQETRALPPFVLGLELPRYLEKPGELRARFVAVGFDGQNQAGQEVRVRLARRVWHSHLRETNFATGEAQYVTEQEDQKLEERVLQSAAEPVAAPFALKESGVYVVELFARDKLGRVQTVSADLFVAGAQPVAWQKSREGTFALSTDKKTYRPGDIAKVVLQSPFQEGRALVVVEDPTGNSYAWVNVRGGTAVHELRVEGRHAPNLPVHALLMRGRVGESPSDDARFRPQTLGASLDLEVEPVRNQVTCVVAHPETARPGTSVDLTVTLADEAKRPLGGEVTLWLVDEAVLSLAKEAPLDPLTRFIERNARALGAYDTRNTVLGRLVEQEEEPGGDGSEELEGSATGRVVRKNFQTVPYYEATLAVPASGKLVVPVKLSDDLTNFRVRAVAASGPARFGVHSSTLKVRLPVIVQPRLPRFVRQGDRFWGGAIARVLEAPEGAAAVELKATGPVSGAPKPRTVELGLGRALSVVSPLTATATAGTGAGATATEGELTLRVSVTRSADKVGDAFEVKLPVLPDRAFERFAFQRRVAAGPLVLDPFPEAPRKGTVSQSLTFTTEPVLLELVSAIEYLRGYPHACLEQRLSALAPALELGALRGALGLDDGAQKAATAEARRLFDELPQYQDDRGLVAFWPGGRGNVALTAQLLEAYVSARKLAIAYDQKPYDRAVAALQRVLRSDYDAEVDAFRYDDQVAAIRALGRAGALDEHYLDDLYQARRGFSVTALSDLAVTMNARPERFAKNLGTLRGELWERVVIKLARGAPVVDALTWGGAGWCGCYLTSKASSFAATFEGLVALDGRNEKLPLLRDALVSLSGPTNGWGNTHANRRALQALARYFDGAAPASVSASVALDWDGAPESSRALRLDDAHKVAVGRSGGEATARGSVTGGALGVRGLYRYLPDTPGDRVTALSQGFVVTRGSSLLRADGAVETEVADAAGATRTVRVGDVLELHARVVTESERHHVALVVPFAAGLEPLNAELATSASNARPAEADSRTPTYVQRLDSEHRYYFDVLPRGTHTFHFRVRASTEGSFVHPAPTVEQMYEPDTRGRGVGLRVVVLGDNERGDGAR